MTSFHDGGQAESTVSSTAGLHRIYPSRPHAPSVMPPGISILPSVLELTGFSVTRHMLPFGKLGRPFYAWACVAQTEQRAKDVNGLAPSYFPGDGLWAAGAVSNSTAQAASTSISASVTCAVCPPKRLGSYVVPSRKM